MAAFLDLVRFPNLLALAFAQYVMRYAVILPLVRFYGAEPHLSGFDFFCLVFATICTAAAGYVINDYFDVKTDKINRPGKVVVGRAIARRKAVMTHIMLAAAGVLTGGYVTWKAGMPELALVFMFVAGMLWLYSSIYKRLFLIGNVIVALFFALVPLLTLLDIPPVYKRYGDILLEKGANLDFAAYWILGVSAFVFLTALSHQIIKDAEDFEGDAAYGCRSLPIVLGNRTTKRVIVGINAAVAVMIGAMYLLFLKNIAGIFSLCYMLTLFAPLAFISWKVSNANSGSDYRRAGNLMKVVMLAGIAYSGVLIFSFHS